LRTLVQVLSKELDHQPSETAIARNQTKESAMAKKGKKDQKKGKKDKKKGKKKK
jgi:hypothetical protein